MFETIAGTLLTSFIGVLGWAIVKGAALNQRMKVVETRQDGLEDLNEATNTLVEQARDDLRDLIDVHFDGMDKRLARIERSMNGHLRD